MTKYQRQQFRAAELKQLTGKVEAPLNLYTQISIQIISSEYHLSLTRRDSREALFEVFRVRELAKRN